MATCAPCLEVGEQRLWRDVSIESLRVLEFLHPRVFHDGEDELRSLSPRRLVGNAVGALGFVRGFCAHTNDGRGIIIYCYVVSPPSCGFYELHSVARCVLCHLPDEANEFVCASQFIVQYLEEERRHDLLYLREVGVVRVYIYWLELFERISKISMISSGVIVSGGRGFRSGSALFRVKCRLRGR